MLRIGLVGCGEQARSNLLPAIRNIPGARVVGVCDVVAERAERVAAGFGIQGAFNSFRELIKQQSVEALILAGPPQMHTKIALYALECRIPVFVEKPPARTTKELEKMAEMASAANVVTAVGHNLRFARPYQVFRDVAQSEDFGNPKSLQIRFLTNKPRQPMWGLGSVLRSFLLAQAIHPIDLMLQWMNSEYDLAISAHVDLESGILLHCWFHGNNLTGSIVTGSMAPNFIFDACVISDRSRLLELDGLWNIAYHGLPNETVQRIPKPQSWRLTSEPSPLDAGYVRAGYQGELESFVRSVIDGSKGPPTFEDELQVYGVMDRIERMARRQID